jgi:hypothetical protein
VTDRLPVRGDGVRELDLALPPARMPLLRHGRPLKRWRYVGYYAADVMLCVGDARIGPLPQRWWAVAGPDGSLREATSVGSGGVKLDGSRVRVEATDVSIDLELRESDGVEVVSPTHDRENYVWTRKQAQVPARGTLVLAGAGRVLDGIAFIDDSAGYHDRHTTWKWSAGNGRATDGRAVAWNLVDGIHDGVGTSERTLWVDGAPWELEPVAFAPDLTAVSFAGGEELAFSEWSAREHDSNLLLMRSAYRQPFGAFAGRLPGGLELAEGYGVMEEHDVHW